MSAPVHVIHKRQWWNLLIENPAGHLAEHLPIERLELSMPRRELVPLGPDWLRGWELPFFLGLLAFALALKVVRRIE